MAAGGRGLAALGADLAAALDSAGPVPTSTPAVLSYVGGRTELTRALSGFSSRAAARAAGDEKAWTNASRQVQRHDTGGAEKRTGWKFTAEQRDRLEARAVDKKWASLVRGGARVRVTGRVQAYAGSPDVRDREIPSGGPGIPVSEDDLIPILDLAEEGNTEQAARLLWATVMDEQPGHYGMPGAELVRLDSLEFVPGS